MESRDDQNGLCDRSARIDSLTGATLERIIDITLSFGTGAQAGDV